MENTSIFHICAVLIGLECMRGLLGRLVRRPNGLEGGTLTHNVLMGDLRTDRARGCVPTGACKAFAPDTASWSNGSTRLAGDQLPGSESAPLALSLLRSLS